MDLFLLSCKCRQHSMVLSYKNMEQYKNDTKMHCELQTFLTNPGHPIRVTCLSPGKLAWIRIITLDDIDVYLTKILEVNINKMFESFEQQIHY